MSTAEPNARPVAAADLGRVEGLSDLIHRVNVGDSLTRTAAALPDQLAVVDGGRLAVGIACARSTAPTTEPEEGPHTPRGVHAHRPQCARAPHGVREVRR